MASFVAGNTVKHLLPVVGNIAQSGGGLLGGAVGGIFGKKGKRIGRTIGRGIVGVGRRILGFQAGGVVIGKVRHPPVRALKKGGIVKKRKSKKKI